MSENMGYNCEIAESVQYIVCSLPEWDADASDAIFEAAGNWTIYTSHCHRIMRESDSENAGFENMGSGVLDGCESFDDVVTKLAFWAVYADLWAEMGTLSDADKLVIRGEDHCEDCGEVFGLDDLDDEREGREGDSICEGCHEDWLEDQDDDEEEVA
jgi:hypothetical protein